MKVFRIVCAWCGCWLGNKVCEFHEPGGNSVTHTVCSACRRKVLSLVRAAIEKKDAEI